MKKILLINGHQEWDFAPGKLNKSMIELAEKVLTGKGYSVNITTVEDGYDPSAEVKKLMATDFIIFQTPVFWFSIPWMFKKYIDQVYMGGHGVMFDDDGRTRSDPSRKYGSGGLMVGKKYMLSVTLNAPQTAFNDAEQIFEGKDLDDVFFSFHIAQKFCGMTPLPTFVDYDVMKNPDIEGDFKRYKEHLNRYF